MSVSPETAALPIISLRKLMTAGPEQASEIERLREITHTIGFFYLADHGVPARLQRDLFGAAKDFFAQPAEVKEEISNLNNPHYRGYAELGDERTQGKVDWREQIDYGFDRAPVTEGLAEHPWRVLEGPNPWPSSVPAIKPLVNEWMDQVTEVSMQLLRSWAISLGQPADFFDGYFDQPYPLLKLVHYPGHDGSQSAQGVGAHHDAGVLTLLLLEEDSEGLQVQDGDSWIDVPALPNHFVVNIGELLEAATSGYLVATPHRVLPPAPGTDRYSIPYFLTPNLDARMPQVELPAELAAAARGIGQDMQGQKIFDITGLNTLKSRLRAHPATTERFHAELAHSLS